MNGSISQQSSFSLDSLSHWETVTVRAWNVSPTRVLILSYHPARKGARFLAALTLALSQWEREIKRELIRIHYGQDAHFGKLLTSSRLPPQIPTLRRQRGPPLPQSSG